MLRVDDLERLTEVIFNEFRLDEESWEKKGANILYLYNKANDEQKESMDHVLISLTGYSLESLVMIADGEQESMHDY